MDKNFYSNFTNMYQVSKTIRMSLEPIGKTAEKMADMIKEDEQRATLYERIKPILDNVHKAYIENSLDNVTLNSLENYEEAFFSNDKDKLDKIKEQLRKEVGKYINKPPYFNKENYKNILESVNDEDKAIVRKFEKFITYFEGFNENRANVYSSEEISTSVPYRLINDNLPKFINNFKVINKAIDVLGVEVLNRVIVDNNLKDFITDIYELTDIKFYNKVLTQSGIDKYNQLLGGTAIEGNVKKQGINELINLHNQKTKQKLPKATFLFKQILSDREKFSFVSNKFSSDEELIEALKINYDYIDKGCLKKSDNSVAILDLFEKINSYDLTGIYIKNDTALTEISQKLFKNWNCINNAINLNYDIEHGNKKQTEKYFEVRRRELNKNKYYSISYLNDVLKKYNFENFCGVEQYFVIYVKEALENICKAYTEFNNYQFSKKLSRDDIAVEIIKKLCDSIKNLQNTLKPLLTDESNLDMSFYSEFNEKYNCINSFGELYNMIRNYLTQKPYKIDKIKLTFNNPNLLHGWGVNNEISNSCFLLKKDNYYYLAILNNKYNKDFKKIITPVDINDIIYKMAYNQIQKPNALIANLMVIDGETQRRTRNLEELKDKYLPENINRIRKSKTYLTSSSDFSKQDLETYIEYYKARITEYKPEYNLNLKNSNEYTTFNDFTDDIKSQAYMLEFIPISNAFINKMVDEGKLYLFKIYCKDFSEHSKGIPNLHTLYWKMLFDEENLKYPVYKLSGGAEMFFRKKSLELDETTIHEANKEIQRKQIGFENQTSLFVYDIIKDKRYTLDKFFLHTSVVMNFQANGKYSVKGTVNKCVKYNDNVNVIGIDRGEKNLLYASVINSNGEILEQKSLNIIDGVDYHILLSKKERERMQERQNWKGIDNISNLKEGYLSKAIHEITDLMQKYNAVIVLEDLNFGFKRGRLKIEKSVYQKFEKMLISKLNYMVDKKLDKNEMGGLLHAYQLTDEVRSLKNIGKQNGIIYYIPAWMTSKIDPTTGFANLFYEKYESVDKAKAFVNKFDLIVFNEKNNYFEFKFDYNNFTTRAEGTKTQWTICSYGDRIRTFRNSEKNNNFDDEIVNLTTSFKDLFEKYNVELSQNMQSDIIRVDKKDFYLEFIKLFNLIVQLRNSSNTLGEDYIISPVKNKNGEFFKSDLQNKSYPIDADANGAYNIARKGLMYLDIIRNTDDNELLKPDLKISQKDWLNYAQKNGVK